MKIKKIFSLLTVLIMIFTLACPTVSAETVNDDSPIIPDEEEILLEIFSPASQSVTTTDSKYTFIGKCDPEYELLLNGSAINCEENGDFCITVELNPGKNVFTFTQNEQTLTYTVNYNYKIVSSFSPSSSKTYNAGASFTVTVKARKSSTVTATFRKKTIKLTPAKNTAASDDFISYSGKFTMPKTYAADINYGKITFKATKKSITETYTSQNIICKRATQKNVKYVAKDPKYKLSGGKYINVGKGLISEVTAYEAETFNGKSTNDWSRPTNNYLPKGTIDYAAKSYVYSKGTSEKKQYSLLRCGYQVYTKRKNAPYTGKVTIAKRYSGTLPDHNEIGIVSLKNGTSHTILTLDTMWKAPFYLGIYPQTYENASKQNYKISQATYQYVDITLCYSTVLKGKITVPKDNPIFKSAKIFKYKSHYKIRLYLKKVGGFYGWTADFNSKGQLIFKFLNPAKISKSNNKYGYSLKGVKVLIDVGHGGSDPGAVSYSKTYTEANRNLYLAKKIKKELERTGATVYMTRTTNKTSSLDDKLKMLRDLQPDFCIAVHHNSNYSSSANGFDSYYSQPFSIQAAKYIKTQTSKTKIYNKSNLGWHYYFTARSSVCPVVLTENGFMSNYKDYQNAKNAAKNTAKAEAITKGIVQYFRSIQ